MAQTPATPKLRRHLLRLAAAISPGMAGSMIPAQPSEAIALKLRETAPTRPDDPYVTFLIPLVGRHHVGDWTAVSQRLRRTLDCLVAQTSPNWRAMICGQDKPEGFAPSDQIQFLPFTETVDGNDKWNKSSNLCKALPDFAPDGYVMPFDADDLLANDAVEHMINARDAGGYLVERGYVLDAATGTIARTAPQSVSAPGQKAFWKLCGSCAAFRFHADHAARDAAFIDAATSHEHRMFPYLAALAGRPLKPLAFYAALYILNHGENFGARRGRVGFKSRFVSRFEDNRDTTRADIARRFGAGDLLE